MRAIFQDEMTGEAVHLTPPAPTNFIVLNGYVYRIVVEKLGPAIMPREPITVSTDPRDTHPDNVRPATDRDGVVSEPI